MFLFTFRVALLTVDTCVKLGNLFISGGAPFKAVFFDRKKAFFCYHFFFKKMDFRQRITGFFYIDTQSIYLQNDVNYGILLEFWQLRRHTLLLKNHAKIDFAKNIWNRYFYYIFRLFCFFEKLHIYMVIQAGIFSFIFAVRREFLVLWKVKVLRICWFFKKKKLSLIPEKIRQF